MAIGDKRQVTVCCVPYEMTIIEGGVLFSDKAGFYGLYHRYTFEFRHLLWYLSENVGTSDSTPLCHLKAMHSLLSKHVCPDHGEFTHQFVELPASSAVRQET